ncbi:alpha-L-arabinofuranosidase C-terminal domain-containing protein [Limosilactobacillus fermentum]|uniref:alpha-L-arabinofuranosidase C-terminal domain-containing protein n=1 Tax=Limosilactobacillus fermentum TaxID=1613 RepID=UPI00240DBEE9|nr:alpha-L-arabinofuranosidase C-terminal domain-containing protein [Limosilactobacillus fermentum]WFA01718.1 alpha-L-arabinofuranosidase C-terminal domain-containing protein [Limosilactobacillus fermentum]
MSVFIDPKQVVGKINPKLHGQFIEFLGKCIDEGLWVGENSTIPNTKGIRNDVLALLKQLEPPVLRWPGGCYADTYHWRDGIGPRDQRLVSFNENFGTYESDQHQFGTDEFMQLCEELGAQPWTNVNLLSGTVAEMRDWMEYVNRSEETTLSKERAQNGHPQPYNAWMWGLGNEVWAGGGTMDPATYMSEYRRFASAMPSFTHSVFEKTKMYAIVSGPDSNKPREAVKWTEDFFKELAKYRQPKIDGYDMHFYNWNIDDQDDTPTDFTKEGWQRVIDGCFELEDLIKAQASLLRNGLELINEPEGKLDQKLTDVDLIVGEWGNWHYSAFTARPALQQQVSMRDVITTALTLDILQRNCDKVTMACNAQTINVLNSLALTKGDKIVATPNFDVFMMYKDHRDAQALAVPRQDSESQVDTFASLKGAKVCVNLVNASYDEERLINLVFPSQVKPEFVTQLTADDPHACNTFEEPNLVRAKPVKANSKVAKQH